jgi:hypothetical protein
MTVHWNRVVKTVLRFAGLGLLIFAVLFAVSLWYSTAHGYTTWWFSSSSQVAIDGVRSGFLHVNTGHSAVIITRTDLRPSQSYLVGLSGRKFLIHCGDWQAPRLPAFPIGDVNPPCSFFSNGSDLPVADNAVFSTLTARPGFVEFQTARGKKVIRCCIVTSWNLCFKSKPHELYPLVNILPLPHLVEERSDSEPILTSGA